MTLLRAVSPRMVAFATILVVLLTSVGCHSSSSSPSDSKASVLIGFTPSGGTYTAQFNGQTFTAAGAFTFSLSPGTYNVAGTFTGPVFIVLFSSLSGGGVQSGSVKSLAGPNPDVSPCNLVYSSSSTQAQSFNVQFQVTASVGSACQ